MVTIIAVLITGYLFGSIPTGVWLGRIIRGIDIRQHGSGSTGATNVFRILGVKLAIAVLVVDVLKGFVACYLGSRINFGDTILVSDQLAASGGLAAVAGHLYPLFAGFRGGKGIATGAGMLLFLSPLEVGFALIVFVAAVYLTRYVSLGSITAAVFYFVSIVIERYYLEYPVGGEVVALATVLLVLVLFTHRANIRRLISGTENKFGAKK